MAGMVFQTIIASHLDSNKLVLIASLELSAAFDIVNTKLLIKRLRIVGLPEDVISLVELWLSDHSYYVTVNSINSSVVDLT